TILPPGDAVAFWTYHTKCTTQGYMINKRCPTLDRLLRPHPSPVTPEGAIISVQENRTPPHTPPPPARAQIAAAPVPWRVFHKPFSHSRCSTSSQSPRTTLPPNRVVPAGLLCHVQ